MADVVGGTLLRFENLPLRPGVRPSATGSPAAWLRAIALPLAVSLISLRTLASGGYLLQVDTAFGPHAPPVEGGFYAPISALQRIVWILLGGALTGRLYAIGALFVAGFAPMVLFRGSAWYAQSAAGVLGALNPWVYDRMAEGQWAVVVAASGLFLWLAAWERLQAKPGLRTAATLGICAAAITAFDAHVAGLVLVLIVLGALWGRIWREPAQWRWTLISLGFWTLLSLYGVLAFALSNERVSYQTVRAFGRADFQTFRSSSSSEYGLVPALAGLYGYWGERLGRVPATDGAAPWWLLSTIVTTGLTLWGAWLYRRRAWLLGAGAVGLLVAASTALPGGVDAATWLAARFPLVGIYREPGKWSALWLLAVVTLSVSAIDALRESERPRLPGWSAPALSYVLIIAALLPAGLNALRWLPVIVKPVHFPTDWLRAAAYLHRTVPASERVLVLPWHQYEGLSFADGRLVLNPAPVIFPGNLIVPNDPELPGNGGTAPTNAGIDEAKLMNARGCTLSQATRTAGIRWIVVEDAVNGQADADALRRCGFALAEGTLPGTVVLAMGHG